MDLLSKIQVAAQGGFPNWMELGRELEGMKHLSLLAWDTIHRDEHRLEIVHFLREFALESLSANDPLSAYLVLLHAMEREGALPGNPPWKIGRSSGFILAREIARIPRFDKSYIKAGLFWADFLVDVRWRLLANPNYFLENDKSMVRSWCSNEHTPEKERALLGIAELVIARGLSWPLTVFCDVDKAEKYTRDAQWGFLLQGRTLMGGLHDAFEYGADEVASPYFARRFQLS